MAYSDSFVTEAIIRLAANKYDYNKTAEQVGVPARTIRNWEKSFPKKGVPELLDRAIERMLMVIPDKWHGQDWAIALGILIDKWLLIQGEPTERTENLVKHFEGLTNEEREAVIDRAREILTGMGGAGNIDGKNGHGPAQHIQDEIS